MDLHAHWHLKWNWKKILIHVLSCVLRNALKYKMIIIGIAFMIERLSHIYITSITVALSRLNSLVITFRITRTIVRW